MSNVTHTYDIPIIATLNNATLVMIHPIITQNYIIKGKNDNVSPTII